MFPEVPSKVPHILKVHYSTFNFSRHELCTNNLAKKKKKKNPEHVVSDKCHIVFRFKRPHFNVTKYLKNENGIILTEMNQLIFKGGANL